MSTHRATLRWIALLFPISMAVALVLGPGWAAPWDLFLPEQRGILEIRAWRVLLGAVSGASLAAAGVVLQAILRNPLAEPYILGVSAGAGVGAASAIVWGGLALGALVLPMGGFAGGLISLFAVYLLARVDTRTAPHTLILAGVAWGALCSSILMFFVSRSTAEGLHAVSWWFLGDLQVYDPGLVLTVALLNACALAAILLRARTLDALTLGDELATHLGVSAERSKILLLALATLLASASVSACGLIAFVGLVIPHIARALAGPSHRRLLPAAILLGAAFLALVDGLGRTLFYPVEVPVGIFTALIGAPFFLALLRKKRRDMWGYAP
ncbi:MAG TPA: iron ABC transporter permease [Kiritimatiellia bacterium]|nr:iron ABC transporter permease [Kiritimatiellia bacterium]